MQVILLEKVENLGSLGDLVNVKSGYARNFLMPYGKAKSATPANLEEFEKMKSEFEKAEKDKLDAANVRASALTEKIISIEANAGAEGKLFGSIGPEDIASAITAGGVDVSKKEIRMPDGPLRSVGTYEVGVHLHSDIDVEISVEIVGIDE